MHETGLPPAPTVPPATAMEALRSVPWLGDVASATMDRLAGRAMVIRLPKGTQIFDQAEIPSFAQFLLAGSIELLAVRGEEETLVELVRPVDMLLPAAVLGALPYLVRARVREDAVLLLVQAEAFRAAVATDQALCLAMLACQSTQFRRQMKLAKAIRLRSAEERVGSFLLALAEAHPAAGEIRLPLEKRQIASQLGMTRETLSRTLPAMPDRGLRVVGDKLFIGDIAAARAAFPYDPLIDGRDPITPLCSSGDPQ
ncbi:MAG: helix-turn-helix domain-containing protein [Pseudomonadota bacterium]